MLLSDVFRIAAFLSSFPTQIVELTYTVAYLPRVQPLTLFADCHATLIVYSELVLRVSFADY